jgi:hypothetical protein
MTRAGEGNGGDWLASIAKRRSKQTIRAGIAAALVLGLWLAVSGLFFWAWFAVFHLPFPGWTLVTIFEGLGSLIVLPLSKFVPLAPLKGEDPEITAAKEFLEGPQR